MLSQYCKKSAIHDAQKITDHKKTNNYIFLFYKELFEQRLQNGIKSYRIFKRYQNRKQQISWQ